MNKTNCSQENYLTILNKVYFCPFHRAATHIICMRKEKEACMLYAFFLFRSVFLHADVKHFGASLRCVEYRFQESFAHHGQALWGAYGKECNLVEFKAQFGQHANLVFIVVDVFPFSNAKELRKLFSEYGVQFVLVFAVRQ